MKTDLQQRGILLGSNLKSQVDVCLELLRSVDQFISTSGSAPVPLDKLRSFVQPMLRRHASICALEWLPRIPHEKRSEYEKLYGLIVEGQSGFERQLAGQRAEYFPVTFVEPLDPNRQAVGFDLGSDPVRRQSLERSRHSQEVVLSRRIELVQDPEKGLGLLVILPCFWSKSGLETLSNDHDLRGFIVGVFRLEDIVKKSLRGLGLDKIDFVLQDRSAPEQEGFLAYYDSSQNKVMAHRQVEAWVRQIIAANPQGSLVSEISSQTISIHTLLMVDRQWSLMLVARTGYVDVVKRAQEQEIHAQTAAAQAEYYRSSLQLVKQAQQRWLVEKRWIGVSIGLTISILLILLLLPILTQITWVGSWLTIEQVVILSRAGMLIILIFLVIVYYLIQRQISERSATESKLIETTDNLEAHIKTQQREIHTTRELSETKLKFFSMISHEIRTPLSTILISAQALQPLIKDIKPQKYLNRITTAADLMSRLLADILVIIRAESGFLETTFQWVDIDTICQECVSHLQDPDQPRIQYQSLSLGIQAFTDQRILNSIISNLLSNALKYSQKQVNLKVRAQQDQVLIQVQDWGQGIPAHELPHLFEAFRRGKGVSRIPGSGLGLTLVRVCAAKLQGWIEVESEVGKGTIFTIGIPIQARPPESDH